MSSQFLDRRSEERFLRSMYGRAGAKLVVIYGRRRIGKTRLIAEFCKNKSNLYLMAVESSLRNNINNFQKDMARFLKDDSYAKLNLENFEELFSEFFSWHGNRKLVLVIDEFPYLFYNHPGILSEFQRIWDLDLSNRKIMMILCGSSIGMMEEKVLAPKAPLYGRRTGQWKLSHLPLTSLLELFPNYSYEDIFRTYGVLDTIPSYMLKYDPGASFWKNVEMRTMRKGEFLFEEGKILLKQELREISNYAFVLQSIASGHMRLKDITDHTGLDKGALSRYIFNLKSLGIITYEMPVGIPEKTKIGHYKFSDNYMQFYFKFIYPHMTELETETFDLDSIKESYNRYMGIVFEYGIRRILSSSGAYSKVGRWWYKGSEIDIVAEGVGKQEVMLGEVKWTNRKVGLNTLADLKEKGELIKKYRKFKKSYMLVSKSGFKKDLLQDDSVHLWDLDKVIAKVKNFEA